MKFISFDHSITPITTSPSVPSHSPMTSPVTSAPSSPPSSALSNAHTCTLTTSNPTPSSNSSTIAPLTSTSVTASKGPICTPINTSKSLYSNHYVPLIPPYPHDHFTRYSHLPIFHQLTSPLTHQNTNFTTVH